MTKPQLAEDANLDIIQFPCWVQPKIDGVRAMNLKGTLTGRSLDPFKGLGITEFFSRPEFEGFDGEMIVGDDPASPDRLCSVTTGAMGRFKGVSEMEDLHWWLFDYVTPYSVKFSYENRYDMLASRLLKLKHDRLHLVPYSVCDNRDQLDAKILWNLEQGYEGTITRNPHAVFKPGRATQKGQELWRVKPWADAEILVTGITEGNKNENEAKRNTLGRTERSSSAAGMVPNGMIGSIQGTLLEDFHDPNNGGKKLFSKGLPCTIAPGAMTDAEAKHLFEHPDEIVNHIVKFQHMTHGVKDQPRFGGYLSHRLKEDMGMPA